jgi:hypothetical protein
MKRASVIPAGVWPPRMPVEMAAGFCGERSAEAFLRGVREKLYPEPRIKRGRKQIWWKDDLDLVATPHGAGAVEDVAVDL